MNTSAPGLEDKGVEREGLELAERVTPASELTGCFRFQNPELHQRSSIQEMAMSGEQSPVPRSDRRLEAALAALSHPLGHQVLDRGLEPRLGRQLDVGLGLPQTDDGFNQSVVDQRQPQLD